MTHIHTVAAVEQQEPGSFRHIYSLDKTRPNESCPDALTLQTVDSLRLCGKKFGFRPNHITVPVNGQSYQQLRGRVITYQAGTTDAFHKFSDSNCISIDDVYVDGISITRGQSPRIHVWTYAIGQRGGGKSSCPSIGGQKPPGFVGENYFCSAGNPASSIARKYIVYPTPLWSSIFGNVEDNDLYFCVSFRDPTTDDLEIRVITDETRGNEDIYIQSIDFYV